MRICLIISSYFFSYGKTAGCYNQTIKGVLNIFAHLLCPATEYSFKPYKRLWIELSSLFIKFSSYANLLLFSPFYATFLVTNLKA